MINRQLIRIKVLQVLYNYYTSGGTMNVERAKEVLLEALDAAYRLYVTFSGFPLALAEVAEERLDVEEGKFIRDEARIALLKQIADNLLVAHIRADEGYMALLKEQGYDTPALQAYHENVLDRLLEGASEAQVQWSDFTTVREWWRGVYLAEYAQSEVMAERIEELDIYLNDGADIILSFVTKLFNGLTTTKPYSQQLRPQYDSVGHRTFGPDLLGYAMAEGEAYRTLVAQYLKNWDQDRVSLMDYIIMQTAVAEAIHFPAVATTVILNEYLNLAHSYSSPKSSSYINGILHELFTTLKAEGRILGQ